MPPPWQIQSIYKMLRGGGIGRGYGCPVRTRSAPRAPFWAWARLIMWSSHGAGNCLLVSCSNPQGAFVFHCLRQSGASGVVGH